MAETARKAVQSTNVDSFSGIFIPQEWFSDELMEVLGGYLRGGRGEKRLSLPFFEGDEPGFHAENLAISTGTLT